MEKILADATKFKEIKHSDSLKLTLQQEDKVSRLVKNLAKDILFSEPTALVFLFILQSRFPSGTIIAKSN